MPRQAPPQFLNILLLTATEVPIMKKFDNGYLINWATEYRNGRPFHCVHYAPISKQCNRLAYSDKYPTYYTNDLNTLNQLGAQGVDWDFCGNCPAR